MSRIDLNVVATGNFGQLESQLARLKAQVAGLNASMSSSMMVSPTAIASMQNYANLMADNLRSTGMFQTKMVSLTSETERFGQSLQRGNIRLGDYFRTATGHIRNQQTEIQRLAREQVRLMNSTSLAMGDGRAMVITPTGIDEAIHKQQILNQEYRIFRQVVQGGSTQLINWGKNTQWAGRQLTVGLTVPLTIFGAAASKVFMDADKQLTRMAKVYGDASKGMVNTQELQSIRQETLALAQEIASSMGVAVEETLGLAADIAATGAQGNELLAATNEAVRLSVLGEVDRQEAMQATLAIQSVFKKDTAGLADSINFLNAVENQTSTSLNDLTIGIVKAGPVVQGLGGSIEDLSMMMVAMREGGVPASEAANAIKSSLASLINPTKQTTEVLSDFGINLVEIVNKNAGDVIGTLGDLQNALSGLDELSRQRAVEQIFGKFQFARINALLNNLNKAGSQTEQVFALAGMSASELAVNADRELKAVTESVSGRFQRAMESLKANLIPIGEIFTKVATMLLDVGSKILEIFNNLPAPVKNFVQGLTFLTALAGPIIMITGVFGNFLGYLLKGVSSLMAIKQAGRGVFEYFTPESIAARNASELITEAFYDETTAVGKLNTALEQLTATMREIQNVSVASAASMGKMSAETMSSAEAAALGKYADPRFRFTGSGGKTSGVSKPHYYSATQFAKDAKAEGAPAEFANLTAAQIKGGLRSQHMIAPGGEYGLVQGQLGDQPALYSNAQEREQLLSQVTSIIERGGFQVEPEAALKAVTASREEFIQRQAEFRARLQALSELPSETLVRLSASLNEASTQGGNVAAAAERLVSQAIETDKNAVRKYGQARAETISHLSSMSELSTEDFAREASLYTGAEEIKARTALSAKGMTADIGTKLDGAIQTSMISLGAQYAADGAMAVQTATAQAVGKTRENFIFEAKKAGARLVRYTNASGEKFIADITNGLDNAVVYAINSSTDKIDRVLTSSKAKQSLRGARAQAAIARFEMAEERLNSIVVSDIDQATLAQQQAAAQANPAGGRFSRVKGFMSGKGGMVGLGALSMTSMLAPTGGNENANVAMNILGATGMGASMGAMAGPIGAIVGGALGLAGSSIMEMAAATQRTYDEARKRIESIKAEFGSLTQGEQNLLGVDIKSISDMTFNSLNKKTEEAASAVEEFAQSIRDASEGTAEYTKAQAFRNATSAEDILSSGTYRMLIGTALATNADPAGVRNILEAYMKATDKQVYAAELFAGAEESMASGLLGFIESERSRVVLANSELLAGFKQYMPGTYGEYDPMQAGRDFAEASRNFNNFATQGIKIEGMDIKDLASAIIDPNFIAQLSRNAEGVGPGIGYRTYQIQINGQDISAEQSQEILDSISSITQNVTATSNSQMINPAIKQNLDLVQKFREEVSLAGNVIAEAFATQSLADFEDSILPIVNLVGLTTDELGQFKSQLPTNGRKVFDEIMKSTNSMAAAMAAARLAVADVGYDIDNLRNKTAGEILLTVRQIVVTEQIQQGLATVTGAAEFSGQTAEQRADSAKSGGGGSGGSSAVSDAYDKQIKKQDKIIENIKKEREERQKLYDLEKKAFDFAMQEQDLKNQIARARAEGRTAEAAMLQAQLDNTRATNKEQEQEKVRQEQEDKKIAAAEKRKKQLEKEKQAATGGGGGGGSSAEDKVKEIAYLTRAAIDGVLKEVSEESVLLSPEEFLNTKEVQKMMKQLRDGYGATVEEAQQYAMNFYNASNQMLISGLTDLDALRDRFTTQLGIYDEFTNLPEDQRAEIQSNLEFIMFNPVLSNDEKIKEAVNLFRNLGLGPKEAADAAKQSYDIIKNLYGEGGAQTIVDEFRSEWGKIKEEFNPETAEKISTIFLEGIKNGSTKKEILDQISSEIYKATYTDGIERGLNPTVAAALADGMATEVKNKTSKAMEGYEVEVPYVASYDDGVLPDWLKSSMSLGAANKGMRAMGFDVTHKWEGDVTADLGTLGTSSNPMHITGTVTTTSTAAMGGLIMRGTGGMIYGPGGPTEDKIPTMLSNGEYVIRASSVNKYGIPFLDALNKGMLPNMVSKYPSVANGMYMGGYARSGYASGGLVSGKESEYNINVYVTESNASADDIASKVMQSLQRRDKMNRAGIRI